MSYGLHNEWMDGTFEDKPFARASNKREAERVAKRCARNISPDGDVARILVCDANLNTVAVFEPPHAIAEALCAPR